MARFVKRGAPFIPSSDFVSIHFRNYIRKGAGDYSLKKGRQIVVLRTAVLYCSQHCGTSKLPTRAFRVTRDLSLSVSSRRCWDLVSIADNGKVKGISLDRIVGEVIERMILDFQLRP